MNADITLVNVNLMYALIDGAADFQVYEPLGLMYIASCLEQEGYAVDFRDYQLAVKQDMRNPFNLESFARFMSGAAEIIGFSCMSNLLPFTLLMARRLKQDDPGKVVILGGAGPTGVAREIIDNFAWIDYVCSGEGERSMLTLMKLLKSGTRPAPGPCKAAPGFYFRRRGGIEYLAQPRITHLDDLPFPAYHLIDFKQYDAACSIVTSRGCTYGCTFCTETRHWNHRVVFRGVENVIAELRYIARYSPKKIFLFQDDQITLRRERAVRLLRRLAGENLGMHWKCFARVDQVDEELLSLMAEAGCIQVRFGIESGSNRILRQIKKGFSIQQAYRVVRQAVRFIPSVHASFIWGYPFETTAQCGETMEWARRFHHAGCTVLLFLLSPLPNSGIFLDYSGPLDFNPGLMANFNCSGGENQTRTGTSVVRRTGYMFDFIRRHPRIFPGFYLYDYENNIRPKMRIVRRRRSLIFRGIKDIKVGDYDLVDL
jgi:anaerobic magnesium-protoporphyrin IX monomethyl ester cyclase